MARRLDWEKANRKARRRPKGTWKPKQDRQQILSELVLERGLACFMCGTTSAEWALTGANRRGPRTGRYPLAALAELFSRRSLERCTEALVRWAREA
jgi:hypothetical protein